MLQEESIQSVAAELGITTSGKDIVAGKRVLVEKINELIQTDFSKLANILYKVDVSESRLRSLLDANTGQDAAEIIVDLMIERQNQKIISKRENKNNNIIPDDEQW